MEPISRKMLVYILCLLLTETIAMRPFVESDLNSDRTFLIYFYDDREGYRCESCKHFNETIQNLSLIDAYSVNYADNQDVFMRFLLYYVPYFIVRSQRRSYVINPKDKEDLIRIIKDQEWRQALPLKWYFEPTSIFMRLTSRFVYASNKIYDTIYSYLQYVPRYLIYTIYGMVIGYLIFSIKGILVEIFREVKSKSE